jgi:hypothetical protein
VGGVTWKDERGKYLRRPALSVRRIVVRIGAVTRPVCNTSPCVWLSLLVLRDDSREIVAVVNVIGWTDVVIAAPGVHLDE